MQSIGGYGPEDKATDKVYWRCNTNFNRISLSHLREETVGWTCFSFLPFVYITHETRKSDNSVDPFWSRNDSLMKRCNTQNHHYIHVKDNVTFWIGAVREIMVSAC